MFFDGLSDSCESDDESVSSEPAVLQASRRGDLDKMKLLLDASKKPLSGEVSVPLLQKCFRGACEAPGFFEQSEDAKAAQRKGCLAIVKDLAVRYKPALESEAAAMLAISLAHGHAEAAKFIIDHFGLDVNVKIPEEEYEYDPEYTSVTIVHRWPLEMSLLSAEVCKMLLSYPVEVGITTAKGTPLQYACHYRRGDVVRELLKHPAIDTTGVWQSLFAECSSSRPWPEGVEVAELLLGHPRAKKALNHRGKSGFTPLFARLQTVDQRLIKLLLAVPELDVRDVDEQGQSFLHRLLGRPPWPRTCPPDLLRSVLARDEVDLHSKDKEGRNAVDVVLHRLERVPQEEKGTLPALKAVLEEHGALPTDVPKISFTLRDGKVCELKEKSCMEASQVFRAYLTTEVGVFQRQFSLKEVSENTFRFMQAVIEQKPEPNLSDLLASRKRARGQQTTTTDHQTLKELLVAADKYMIMPLQDKLEALVAQLLRTSEEAEALVAFAEAEVDALFARRLGQKLLAPVAQKLVEQQKPARAVAHMMSLGRKFDVAELLQCSWQCRRRHSGPVFTITFEADGSCLVASGGVHERSSYVISPNSYRNGAYARNDVMLEIKSQELKSDPFWCTGRDACGNWAPEFVQCWQYETDFVLSAVSQRPQSVQD